jgi:nickel-dependent lactate racemase
LTIELAYGVRPLRLPEDLEAEAVLPAAPEGVEPAQALERALAHSIGSRPLGEIATARTHVVIVFGRGPPGTARAEAFAAIRRALSAVADERITLAIANGLDPPAALDRLGLPPDVLRRHRVVNHDARDKAATVDMGRTSRGTRISVNRCIAEADVVVAAGFIRPDVAAGWSGGAETIFLGLGGAEAFGRDPPLDADPASRLGRADANPFREDLEEAVRRMGRDTFLLDVVEVGGRTVGAVAGDLLYAHRAGMDVARRWCEVEAAPADVVVVSAPPPESSRLDRATPLLAPAGLLTREGGSIVLAAECSEGTGPEDVLIRIWSKRVRRYLPSRCSIFLVSALDRPTVERTYARWAPDLAAAIAQAGAAAAGQRVLVLPDARDVVPVGRG